MRGWRQGISPYLLYCDAGCAMVPHLRSFVRNTVLLHRQYDGQVGLVESLTAKKVKLDCTQGTIYQHQCIKLDTEEEDSYSDSFDCAEDATPTKQPASAIDHGSPDTVATLMFSHVATKDAALKHIWELEALANYEDRADNKTVAEIKKAWAEEEINYPLQTSFVECFTAKFLLQNRYFSKYDNNEP